MKKDEHMAEGGEVNDEELMDHVAMEAVHAVHARDHDGFKNALHVMVSHTLKKLSDEMESKETE